MLTPRLGPVGSQRRGRAARRWLLAIVVLAVAGCAQPGARAVGGAVPPPATVTVGPGDAGKTVNLRVGDHLVVELSAARQPVRLLRPWKLQVPPSRVLQRLDRDSTLTRAVLVAEAPGTVRLLLLPGERCDPPLACPMIGASGQNDRTHRPSLGLPIIIRVQ
jgi:hypothetical protein